MGKKNEQSSSKNWKCDKCGDTYSSPLPVSDVLCATCSKKAGGKETWMKPLAN